MREQSPLAGMATRHLTRSPGRKLTHTQAPQGPVSALNSRTSRYSCQHQWQGHVVNRAQFRHQLPELKHEPELRTPKARQLSSRQG